MAKLIKKLQKRENGKRTMRSLLRDVRGEMVEYVGKVFIGLALIGFVWAIVVGVQKLTKKQGAAIEQLPGTVGEATQFDPNK
jgi:hypothetical protein